MTAVHQPACRTVFAALTLTFLLAGCGGVSGTLGSAVDVGTCPGKVNQQALGAFVVVPERRLQEFKSLERTATRPPSRGNFVWLDTLPRGSRFAPPNYALTRDVRPDRMTVYTNEDGRILKIECE